VAMGSEQYRMNDLNPMQQWNQHISTMGLASMNSVLTDPLLRQQLTALLGPAVRFDEPMARHTSMGIGGPADAFAEPETQEQLRQLAAWAAGNQIPCTVVGMGTNLLVKTGGIRGLVIRLNRIASDTHWATEGSRIRIRVGLGVPTKTICALALRRGWQGMNFALGIPGHLGGAVAMNAGSHLGSMGDAVAGLKVLTARAQYISLDKASLNWHYRRCELPPNIGPNPIMVEAELLLTPGDRESLRSQARDVMKSRTARQPMGMPSAGSFFKNPAPDKAAGRLIDEAGLKGLTVGRAQVSTVHANFIVNLGGATAEDVLQLKDQIQTTVWQQFAVELIPEVHIVGETAIA